MTTPPLKCAFCGEPCDAAFSIHRDGWDTGPEVPLCQACGGSDAPTCETIWAKIANPEPLIEAMKEVTP